MFNTSELLLNNALLKECVVSEVGLFSVVALRHWLEVWLDI